MARLRVVYGAAAAVVCAYLLVINYTLGPQWEHQGPSLTSLRMPAKIFKDADTLYGCTLPEGYEDDSHNVNEVGQPCIRRLANSLAFFAGSVFDMSLTQVEETLFPLVKPTSVLSITSTVNTAALCSAVSPNAPCRLAETLSRPDPTTMRTTLAKIYPVFADVNPSTPYIEHHVASALHNVELQHISPVNTDNGVSIAYHPSIPLFADYVSPADTNIIPPNELLDIYSTAESRVEMKKHTLLTDISHTNVHFRTRAVPLPSTHCSVPPTSALNAPQPLVVLVVSGDVPLENVPRAVRTVRYHCVPASRVPVYNAPIMVVLPPALDAMAGSLAALLHDFPDVEVVSAAEYRGSIAHVVNELVQMRVDHSFARLEEQGIAGEGVWRGASRVAMLHLASLRLEGPSTAEEAELPLLNDMLDILSSPADVSVPPRLCIAHKQPTTAGALGLSVLPMPTFNEDLPRHSLLISAAEVDQQHWEQPLPHVAPPPPVPAPTPAPAPGSEPASADAPAGATPVTDVPTAPLPGWFVRTSPEAPVHSCAALFATLIAEKAQQSRPVHAAATLVRYSSLPLPLTPALTQPTVSVAQQHAETKNVRAGDALLVALDQPHVYQPQRVAIFSARDTQRYKVPRVGILAHANAYAARAQGPGYSYTALVGLRADEVVRWDTLSARCSAAAAGECSALEAAFAASVLGNQDLHRVPMTVPDVYPYVALISVLRYSRKLALNVRDLPLWPHAPKIMLPLARLPDGRCVASTFLEAAAKPAHIPVPLALSSSLIVRGQQRAWGHARIASLLESLTMNLDGCASVVWPADLPRPTNVVPPVHPLQPHVPSSIVTEPLHAHIDVVRAAIADVAPQLLTTLLAPSATAPTSSVLPPAVVRHNVLIPTLGSGDLPIAGGFMGYINAKDFVNDMSPVGVHQWRADAMNGVYSSCTVREQPLEAYAQMLMARDGIDLIAARKEAALALAKLRRSPLGMLVESVRDSMLVVRDYYEGRSTLKPMVFPHPPLVELTVWVGYDAGDKAWDNHRSETIMRAALAMLVGNIPFQLRPVRLQGFRSSPNWIWTAMAQRSYDAGGDFFLQINDDVTWHTKHWVHMALQNMMTRPVPGFGVMGPRDLGRADMFQQIMFGRRHVEIVGGYTHPRFRNLHGDDFVSHLYGADRGVTRGLKMIVSNPVCPPRYDFVHVLEELMTRYRQEEQSRVLAYLELYIRNYAVAYRTLLGKWAQDKYKLFISEETYEQPSFCAF